MATSKKLLEVATKIAASTSVNEQMGLLADHGLDITVAYLELCGVKQEKSSKKIKKTR